MTWKRQFCIALTTIKQADVDGADMFPAVSGRFLDWIDTGPYRLYSWAFFDVGQFRLDCTRFGLVFRAGAPQGGGAHSLSRNSEIIGTTVSALSNKNKWPPPCTR